MLNNVLLSNHSLHEIVIHGNSELEYRETRESESEKREREREKDREKEKKIQKKRAINKQQIPSNCLHR